MSVEVEEIQSRRMFTGRRLVMLDKHANVKKIEDVSQDVSLNFAFSSDFSAPGKNFEKALEQADGLVFENLGIAVVKEAYEDQVRKIAEGPRARRVFLYDEPERYLYALNRPVRSIGKNLLRWLLSLLVNKKKVLLPSPLPTQFADDALATWGVHASQALMSPYSGKGVKLAVLDTGMVTTHHDFANRIIEARSFVNGETVMDLNGHGTHCTGLAAGGTNAEGLRYGIAYDADIYIGKVLSNEGSGTDSSILAGIEWAITNGCQLISMSLGGPVHPGQTYSRIYNDIATRAMERGTLIIAAAGNDSKRSKGLIRPVSHPANCPAIMGVGAMDRKLSVADFSCGGINEDGGEINIAGPGVSVFSTYKDPQGYATLSGTSMATPFVTGIAAQLWEKYPEATARQIWDLLAKEARKFDIPASDIGAGLVQSPKS
jgi:subtilisin